MHEFNKARDWLVTLAMTPGVNEAIIRPKFSAESLRGARIKTAFSVIASPDKEVL